MPKSKGSWYLQGSSPRSLLEAVVSIPIAFCMVIGLVVHYLGFREGYKGPEVDMR